MSVSIYYFSGEYRQVDFYRRLKNRAMNTAKVLVEVKEVNAELLRRMERNNPASLPDQYIVIFDNKNKPLYSSEANSVIAIDSVLLRHIRRDDEIKFRQKNYEVLGFVFNDDSGSFTIIAAATDVYGLDALRNLRNVLLTTFAISLVFVAILGWIYAGRILNPISNIVKEVGKITEANLSKRVEVKNSNDELGKLANTFNLMLRRLEHAFAAQKTFIANASHEIKTPLTVMSGEIEVTLLQERTASYYKKILTSVLTSIKGLNSLFTQLLFLAQTSSDQSTRNFSVLRVDDILWDVKEELVRLNHNYVIEISFDMNINHESLTVFADEQLLKIAMLNLMDNGCKYSDNAQVVVNLNTATPGKIGIEFLNTGPGIEADVQERIFDPFFRATSNKNIRGFGVGLSLVKRIVALHNGTISVSSGQKNVTRFSVFLPTSPSI
jgi:signal transduction histidine kinase